MAIDVRDEGPYVRIRHTEAVRAHAFAGLVVGVGFVALVPPWSELSFIANSASRGIEVLAILAFLWRASRVAVLVDPRSHSVIVRNIIKDTIIQEESFSDVVLDTGFAFPGVKIITQAGDQIPVSALAAVKNRWRAGFPAVDEIEELRQAGDELLRARR